MKTTLNTFRLKIESPLDILIHKINKIVLGIEKADTLKWARHIQYIRKRYFEDGIWNFNGVKLPEYLPEPTGWLMYAIYMDTLFVYCNHNDNYSSSLIDKLDNYLPEGTYGYKNNEIDVTVKEGDIVIDAGAWIGDFSAYASVKGAEVYAFEPYAESIGYLKKTQKLNPNIQIIEKGLSNRKGQTYMSVNRSNPGGNHLCKKNNHSEKVEITSLDKFVKENNIDRINFIKADIEGHERFMLMGAKNVLKNFAPNLAICTYHLPDDPQVIAKIIKESNPNYRIVQKRKKLYAMAIEN